MLGISINFSGSSGATVATLKTVEIQKNWVALNHYDSLNTVVS